MQTDFGNHGYVGRALRLFAEGMEPYVDEHMRTFDGAGGYRWVEQLPLRHPDRGWRGALDSTEDPRFLLRVLTEEWRAFQPELTRLHGNYASELRDVGNRWAHNSSLPDADVDRMIGTAIRLLAVAEAETEITELRRLRDDYRGRRTTGVDDEAIQIVPSETSSLPGFQDALEGHVPTHEEPMPPAGAHQLENATEESGEPPPSESAAETSAVRSHAPEGGPAVEILEPNRGLRRMRFSAGNLSVEVDYREAINYALVHNEVNPLVSMTLTCHDLEPIEIATISFWLDGDGEQQAGTFSLPPVTVQPDEPVELDLTRTTWTLDARHFAAIDEAVATRIGLHLESDEMPLTVHAPIRLLAHNEWNARMIPELLAAFVTPNTPMIAAVLERAAELLRDRTGDPSLQGYQEGRERALEIGTAIYDALAAWGVRYVNPPTSFEWDGQKIRSVETVLTEKQGTCLDLALAFAAAIEQAGLNPVIVVKTGHAFAGFLVTDSQLSDTVLTDTTMMTNLIHSGLLVTVELTSAVSSRSREFQHSRSDTREHWDPANLDQISFVLDVAAARRRIQPLPRVTRRGDEAVIEIERHEYAPLPSLDSLTSDFRVSEPEETFPLRVERWRKSLLDLSLRNPLLKLKKTSGIELHVPERALALFEDMLASGRTFEVRSGQDLMEIHQAQGRADASELPEAELAEVLGREKVLFARTSLTRHGGQLDRMRRQAKTVIEETGANNLFITIGAIKWFDARGSEALAPMFLIPAVVKGTARTRFHIEIEAGAEPVPNYCLIEKLRRDHDLSISTLESPPRDEHGLDVTTLMQATREQIIEAGARISVESHVRLSMLQFSTLEMWRDVSENWELFTRNPVVKHLVETPTEVFRDPVPQPLLRAEDEATHYLPVPVDGSQLKAVVSATAGRTFVLEGPPGTGKSQTITNMIADALGHGRTVLFVAEKAAALDIVRGRLERAGLEHLALNLHGRHQTIKSVRESLIRARELKVLSGDEHIRTLRDTHLKLIRNLGEYPQILHQQESGFPSVWSAEQSVLSNELALSPELHAFARPEFIAGNILSGATPPVEAFEAAEELGEAARLMGSNKIDPAWDLLGNPEPDFAEIRVRILALEQAFECLGEPLRQALESADDPKYWDHVLPWLADAENSLAITPANLTEISSTGWEHQVAELRESVYQFERDSGPLLSRLGDREREVKTQTLRQEIDEVSRANIFSRRGATRRALEAIEAATGILPGSVPEGEQLISSIERAREERSELSRATQNILRMQVAPRTTNFDFVRSLATEMHTRISNARFAFENVPGIAQLVDDYGRIRVTPGSVDSLIDFKTAWHALIDSFLPRRNDVAKWLGAGPLICRITESLPTWMAAARQGTFTLVKRQRRLQSAMARMQALELGAFVQPVVDGNIPTDQVEPVVRLAVARARLKERLEHTNLDVFQPQERDRRVKSYIETAEMTREELTHQLPARVLRQRSGSASPQAGFGSFAAQIHRKRGGSIRELFERHAQEILETVPVILASPYSVAKYIPPSSVEFDLVIFDEASQIRVADAIGPMGRGRSVVIVGDSQQMPPSSMFAVTEADDDWDDSELETGLTPADQESILSEAVAANLEKQRLSWHYRSQDESLIAFSNEAYYQGKLATFPAPPVSRPGFGIHLRRVEGSFDGGRGGSRTNHIEAERIIEDIRARLRREPDASIGVVTFNSQQRDLLLDLLESSNDRRVHNALTRHRDPLFVKNLENVQGDERDSILFSLAFSPDTETGRLRLNFGPLTAQGGERRLNVAITRARRQVTLFSSFNHTSIDPSRTNSQGVHDLRAYLEYVSHGTTSTVRTGRTETNLYRDALADALREAGLEVEVDLGASSFKVDLAARVPDSPNWVAILLDGPHWAQRLTISDREALPSTVLRGTMGWERVERVWLPSWIRDPESVVRDVSASAEEIAAGSLDSEDIPSPAEHELEILKPVASIAVIPEPLPPQPAELEYSEAEVPPEPNVLAKRAPAREAEPTALTPQETAAPAARRYLPRGEMPTELPFRPAKTTEVAACETLEDLTSPFNRSSVRQELESVIEEEGPVEEQRLARIVGLRFGISRMHSDRRDAILGTLSDGYRKNDLLGDTYYWPLGVSPDQYAYYRGGNQRNRRAISEIPAEEIANAAISLASKRKHISHEGLIEGLKAKFIFKRLGTEVRSKFEKVIRILVEDGILESSGDTLALADFSTW